MSSGQNNPNSDGTAYSADDLTDMLRAFQGPSANPSQPPVGAPQQPPTAGADSIPLQAPPNASTQPPVPQPTHQQHYPQAQYYPPPVPPVNNQPPVMPTAAPPVPAPAPPTRPPEPTVPQGTNGSNGAGVSGQNAAMAQALESFRLASPEAPAPKPKPTAIGSDSQALPVDSSVQPPPPTDEDDPAAEEAAVDAALVEKQLATLRQKVAVAQDILKETIKERKKEEKKKEKKSGKNGLPSKFEISWEKTLRQSKKKPDVLCEKITQLGKTKDPRAISILKPFAHAKAKTVRFHATKAIRRIETDDAAFVLLSLLKDPKPEISRAAFIGLSKRVDATIVEPLLAYGLLNAETRAVASRHFSQVEKAQAQALLEVAHNDNEETGLFALRLYGKATDSDSISEFAPFTKHESADFRRVALECLIRTKNQQVVRFLNKALKDPDEQVRSRAAAGLSNWTSENSGKRLMKLLQDPSVEVRRNAAKSLAKIPKPEYLEQTLGLLQKETDEATLLSLIHAVGQSGSPKAAETLYGLTRRLETDVRIAALSALTKVKDKRALPTLVRLLDDPDAKIREKAVDGLGFKGNVPAITKLNTVLKSDSSVPVRCAAARAVGNIASEKGIPSLKTAMLDDSTVRCQAVIGLRRIGGEQVIPTLIERLADTAPEVRYNAVSALGELEAKDAIPALRRMVEDPNDMVQRSVHKVLGKLGVSVSADLWKRKLQRFSGTIKDNLPIVKVVSLGVLGLLLVVGLPAYFFAGEALGLKAPPPIYPRNVVGAAISPDGRNIIVTREHGVVDLWSVASGKLAARFKMEKDPGGAVFPLNAKEAWLLSNGSEQRWNLNPESEPVNGKRNYPGRHSATVASYNRKFVITKRLSASNFLFWNEDRETTSVRLSGGYDFALAVNADGTAVASANGNNDIMIRETTNWQPTDEFQLVFEQIAGGAKTQLRALAFSPDGKKLAYAANNGQIGALDIETGAQEIYVPEGYSVSSLYWGPDQLVAVKSDTVLFLKPGTEEEPFELENLPIEPDIFSTTEDGTLMLVASRDKKHVAVIDLAAKKIKHELKGIKQTID